MPESRPRSEHEAELVSLRNQQFEANRRAVYVGWSAEELKEHEKRAARIEQLLAELELPDSCI